MLNHVLYSQYAYVIVVVNNVNVRAAIFRCKFNYCEAEILRLKHFAISFYIIS